MEKLMMIISAFWIWEEPHRAENSEKRDELSFLFIIFAILFHKLNSG